ncbi:NUMOD3 domain-containing DNA-binding protein [Priestia megaterium]|uniref:NUMOD3 domain-containing DNA-binding protein n=1 Tax=Priestia megaterium TaxID=1404 RepID=UPI003CC611BE
MLITKTVKVKWNPYNKNYYISKGYSYTKYGDEFDVKTEEAKQISAKIKVKCDYCESDYTEDKVSTYFYKHNKLDNVKKDACPKCTFLKLKERYVERYGEQVVKSVVDFYLHNDDKKEKICAIYSIKLENKYYIGSTTNLNGRFSHHWNELKSGTHDCRELQDDFDKLNRDFSILEWSILSIVNNSDSDISLNEKNFIDSYINDSKVLYNKRKYDASTNKNVNFSKESRNNMSASRRGRRLSDTTKEKMSKAKIGRRLSDETKQKLSIAKRGEKSKSATISNDTVKEIKILLHKGNLMTDISKKMNVKYSIIQSIKSMDSWVHILPELNEEIKNIKYKPIRAGSKNASSKLTEKEVAEIKMLLSQGSHTLKYIAEKFNVSSTLIGHIKRGKLWSHVAI